MIVARLLDGYDATASKGSDDEQVVQSSKASVKANTPSTVSTTAATSRSPLPRVSPSSYTSHAMMLQLQEYRTRVRHAFESTYRHPLAATPSTAAVNTPGSPPKRGTHSGNYCRTRVLESSRQLFARNGAPPIPMSPCSPSRTTVKGGGVAFHRSTTSPRATVQSSLFALGPGQYDVVPRRPATTGSVKFSPADRFREHAGGGNSDPHAPGPGQYLPNDRITARRSARVVFSQLPRQTETAEPPRASITTPSATVDVVSSYYFVPSSGFGAPGDSVAMTGGGIPNWSRTARFPGQKREIFHQSSTQASPTIDYIARNKAKIESMSAKQRQRRRNQQASTKIQQKHKDTEVETRKCSSVRRRNTLFFHDPARSRTRRKSAGTVECDVKELEAKETVSQAWGTLVVLSVAQTKFARLLVVAAVLHRLRHAQEMRYKRITFESWTHVRDRDAMRSLAAALIARSTFRFRLHRRVERKTQAANLLRIFLSGLTFDVRFAMAVRRVQRRITLLQRWWRRARLVVRAREQCLAYKWLIVEQRLRTEHIAQMPHLQRIFQSPAAAVTPGSSNSLMKRRSSVVAGTQNAAVEAHLPMHKLLNLPEQKRWFTARFVLSSDGILRGYSVTNPEAEQGAKAGEIIESTFGEHLVVEVKHFRCHAHGFANLALGLTHAGGDNEGDSDRRPYLMVFKPGASRFILITDMRSLILAPLLDWKEKLERVGGYPIGSLFPSGGSQRDIADMLAQPDTSALDDTVDEVPVPAASPRRGSVSGSVNGERAISGSARRRSSRQHLRRSNVFQPIAEGEMSYYVVDLLRDCPRTPAPIVWSALRDKLREERKNFRSDIYRFNLEIARYQRHERERRQLVVLDKFKEFFTMERPRYPHFRSLISNRKMEALVRQTIEMMKTTQPSNPKFLLPS